MVAILVIVLVLGAVLGSIKLLKSDESAKPVPGPVAERRYEAMMNSSEGKRLGIPPPSDNTNMYIDECRPFTDPKDLDHSWATPETKVELAEIDEWVLRTTTYQLAVCPETGVESANAIGSAYASDSYQWPESIWEQPDGSILVAGQPPVDEDDAETLLRIADQNVGRE